MEAAPPFDGTVTNGHPLADLGEVWKLIFLTGTGLYAMLKAQV